MMDCFGSSRTVLPRQRQTSSCSIIVLRTWVYARPGLGHGPSPAPSRPRGPRPGPVSATVLGSVPAPRPGPVSATVLAGSVPAARPGPVSATVVARLRPCPAARGPALLPLLQPQKKYILSDYGKPRYGSGMGIVRIVWIRSPMSLGVPENPTRS